MNFFDFIAWISDRADDVRWFFSDIYMDHLELYLKYLEWRIERNRRRIEKSGRKTARYCAERPDTFGGVNEPARTIEADGGLSEK